jgi:hypothetical protein
MVKCETCDGTGMCPCGATDCGPKRCPDCVCAWCSEGGVVIVQKDDDGKNVCEACADHYEANCEPRNVSPQDDPNDD